jgi:hypothetical protein
LNVFICFVTSHRARDGDNDLIVRRARSRFSLHADFSIYRVRAALCRGCGTPQH